MNKKSVTIIGVVLAALALAGIAWAATPQGKLTGSLKWNTPGQRPFTNFNGVSTNGIHQIDIDPLNPIIDGETVYVNKNNDPSGDCDGDSGTITVQYTDAGAGSMTYPIICAHFSNYASPTHLGNMSFDYFDAHYGAYLVISVVYKGATKDPLVRYGIATDQHNALVWVNTGTVPSGNAPFNIASSTKKGDVVLTPTQ